MFYGRLQPKRATLAIPVFLLMVGVVGLAAAGEQGGQAPAGNSSTPGVPVKSTTKPAGSKARKAITPKTPSAVSGGAQSQKNAMPSNASIAGGRRDPFKPWLAPISPSHTASEAGPLPPGTRGLVISGLRLEGIVRQQPGNAMIAVVTNYTKRAYFLRLNDAVNDGVVSKITPEAVYFKENTLDSRGRVATHEVEVKLGSAPGEGR